MTKIRVLLADDHDLFRQGVRRLLESSADLEVVGEARTGQDTVRLVEELAPDIVLLDIAMPALSGIDAARLIKTASPRTGLIILPVHREEGVVSEAVKAGGV